LITPKDQKEKMKKYNPKDMTELNDFQQYGKENPYQVPDGFFESISEKTLLLAKQRERIHGKNRMLWQSIAAAASLAALFFIGYQTEFRHEGNVSDLVAVDSQLQSKTHQNAGKKAVRHVEAKELAKQEPAKLSDAQPTGSEAISEVLADFTDDELQQMAALYKSDPFIGESEK